MRRVDFLVLAALLASASIAEARPSTVSMSCAIAAATVAKAGAIVLSTGAHTYDRFVAQQRLLRVGGAAYPRASPDPRQRALRHRICLPSKVA